MKYIQEEMEYTFIYQMHSWWYNETALKKRRVDLMTVYTTDIHPGISRLTSCGSYRNRANGTHRQMVKSNKNHAWKWYHFIIQSEWSLQNSYFKRSTHNTHKYFIFGRFVFYNGNDQGFIVVVMLV